MTKPNSARSYAEQPRVMRNIGKSIVLAYQENVDQLTTALRQEGFTPLVQRAEYSEAELAYTRSSRTFLNHKHAWERAADSNGYTLICESDFVPCKGMGTFPIFWPVEDEMAWGYLYQGSPRLLALVGSEPWLRGHCAPLVAYVVNAPVARILLEFFDDELTRYSLTEYFTFDSHLQWFAMGRDCRAYIPVKHYGEHGGMPNAERRTQDDGYAQTLGHSPSRQLDGTAALPSALCAGKPVQVREGQAVQPFVRLGAIADRQMDGPHQCVRVDHWRPPAYVLLRPSPAPVVRPVHKLHVTGKRWRRCYARQGFASVKRADFNIGIMKELCLDKAERASESLYVEAVK